MFSEDDVPLIHYPASPGEYKRRAVLGVEIGCAYGCGCGGMKVGACKEEVRFYTQRLISFLDILWMMELVPEMDRFAEQGYEEEVVREIYEGEKET